MRVLLLMILVPLFFTTEARAERIKDLTDMAGARANQLIGFGLVAGLSGSGDGKDLVIAAESMQLK